MTDNELRIELLQREVAALRSVIAEFDEDTSCYSQWHCAEAISALLNYLRYGETK